MSEKPKRRWYQFSLRTMLVVVTVLCTGPGWYIAHERAKSAKNQAVEESMKAIRNLGGEVGFRRIPSSRSGLLRWLLGDNRLTTVELVNLENFRDDIRVVDGDLAHLRRFPHLKKLYIYKVPISDAGIAHLSSLTELDALILQRIDLTDSGLVHLAGMTKLEVLNLSNTNLKGPGLCHLSGMKRLTSLSLRGTPVASSDVEALKKAIPGLKITGA